MFSKSPDFKVFDITDVVVLPGNISLRAVHSVQRALASRRFSSIYILPSAIQVNVVVSLCVPAGERACSAPP